MSSLDRGVYAPPLRRDPGFGPIDPHVDEPRRGPMLLLLSVAVLMALVGVIWSTYNQGVRERDEPPRIAALAEPYKIQPADRGGVQADHQGIEVYSVLEDGAVRAAIGSLVDPELAAVEEHLPGVEAIGDWEVVEPHGVGMAPAEGAEDAEPDSVEDAEPTMFAEAEPPASFSGDLTAEEMAAVAPEPSSDPQAENPPSNPGAASPPMSVETAAAIPRLKPLEQDPAERSASGPRTLETIADPSRRYFAFRAPLTRSEPDAGDAEPAQAATPAPTDAPGAPGATAPITAIPPEIATATPSAASPPVDPPVEPTPIVVPGSFLVQLASFRTADAANVGWREFSGEFDDMIGVYAPDVERADLGDRGVHYRLRIGVFTDRTAASSFCDEIKARGRDCLVVGG